MRTAPPASRAVLALRALMILYYLRAWRGEPEARELTGRYLLSFALAFALWAASLAVAPPARYGLWAAAQLVEILNGPVTYATVRHVPRQVSHMDERFGLFVLIVLGEAVVQVAGGLGDERWEAAGVAASVAGFVTAAATWWLYFLRADPEVIQRALRGDRFALLRSYVYGYAHLLVFAGITAAAVGGELAIRLAPTGGWDLAAPPALPHAAPDAAGHAGDPRLVLGAGAAAYLLGVTALQWAAPSGLPRGVIAARLAAAAGTAAFALGRVPLGPVGALAALAAALVALAAYETAGRGAVPNVPAPAAAGDTEFARA